MTTHAAGIVPEWTVGDRLRKARELTGLSAQDFADEIGVSRQTIANAESGTRHPRRITLRAYAMRTGVPLEWLEAGKAPAGPKPDGGLEEERARRDSNPQPADPWSQQLVAVAA